MTTRVAIYARYSSDKQNERSAEDQARLYQERADREGWEVAGIYPDLALSGATRDRPGLNALLDAAERFDIILAESLDRLSRDLEDIAAIWKRLRFADVRLVTLSEGEVGEMHVGLGGTMAALYLSSWRRRRAAARPAEWKRGAFPAGSPTVTGWPTASTPAAGSSAVCARSTPTRPRSCGASSPSSSPAEARRRSRPGSTVTGCRRRSVAFGARRRFLGNRRCGTGLLHNELYVGRIVYNRQRFDKHPVTRKRVARPNPPEKWRIRDVPELAIVDAVSWGTVQARFAVMADVPARQQRRPQLLFSGLIRCGVCEGNYVVAGGGRWRCGNRARGAGCGNAVTIMTAELDQRVLRASS